MEFALNDIQNDIEALAEKVLGDHCDDQQLKALEHGERIDHSLWQTVKETGLLGLSRPEADGGMGLGFFELCLVARQMGRFTAPLPYIYHELASTLLYAQELPTSRVPSEQLLTVAVNERYTLSRLSLCNNQISGELDCVPFAQWADAALIAIPQETGKFGLALLWLDQAAVKQVPQSITSGEPNSRLRLDGAQFQMLGGTELLLNLQQRLSVAVCAMQLGNLEAALEMTTSYTSERKQFGVPVGSFQAVSHRVADAYINISNLKNTTYHAACELDEGREASRAVMVAKYWCGQAGHIGMATFQHVHGGMGADRDYGLWRHTVWSKQFEMQLGSSSEISWLLGESLAGE